LHAQIGQLISRIKALTDIPVAVLTNGSLLWREDLRRQLFAADLVVPSLDAGNQTMFHAVNRPHGGISFERMVGGLVAFRQEYSGPLWLEVMVIGGWNAAPQEIASLAKCIERIRPDRVQLNTVTRPPAEADAVRVPAGQLETLCPLFPSPAEVIADFRGIHQESEFVNGRTEVLGMLQRRPCTLEDIACGLGMHRNEVVKYVEELIDRDALEVWTRGKERFYKAVQ
jgi:wyosine [tRNA(Phe)-imidazoG37] synthetase (radical SAM superfamily)